MIRSEQIRTNRFGAVTMSVFAALGLPGVVFAQAAPPVIAPPVAPPVTAASTPGAGTFTNSAADAAAVRDVPQPSAPTPPTPLPTKAPDTTVAGIKPSSIRPTNLFNGKTPGQPLAGDPTVIRSLDDAIALAFQRNASVLLAEETAYKTVKVVEQIKAIERPQVSASATYSRLANSSSSGAGAGGASLSSLSNPFGVGLTTTPPGTTPIALSSSSTSSGSSLNTTSGTSQSSGSVTAPTAAQTTTGGSSTNSGAATRGEEISRQAAAGAPTGTTLNQAIRNATSLNQDSARITVSQLIDITGIVKSAEKLGDLQEALTRLELARIRQQTAYNVRNGYYNLLRATAFLTVDETAVADSRELLRVTKAQQSAGVASNFDVLTAQTQLDNNIQALISARNQVAVSKTAFANTVGVDPSTPVDPQPQAVPALPDLNEENLITQAFAQRPEAVEADVNLLKAGVNVRLSHRSLEPYINAGITGGYNGSASGFTQDKTTASIGFTLTVPLYDGGATRASVEQARSDQRGALIQKDQFVRGIKSEIQQSILAVQDANERTGAVAATVAEAQEALRLANVRFRAGVGTQLDVNNAQAALVQAQSNQVNAQYDYLGSLARLSLAVGNPQ